jgi:hypothetical protein
LEDEDQRDLDQEADGQLVKLLASPNDVEIVALDFLGPMPQADGEKLRRARILRIVG